MTPSDNNLPAEEGFRLGSQIRGLRREDIAARDSESDIFDSYRKALSLVIPQDDIPLREPATILREGRKVPHGSLSR